MSDMLYSLPSFILSMVMSVYGSRIFRPISRKFTTTISMNNSPPVAKKIATTVYFGTNPSTPDIFRGENIMNPPKLRNDDYFWMRDETRENPAVLAHIEAENAYTEEVMKDLRHLKDDLYADMLANLKETDEDVPFQHGDYMYYSRTMKGLPYPIHCRTPVGSTDEQVVLDENKIGEGYEYSDVSSSEPCPAHKLMAYSVDHDGYETYTLKIIDISTGQHLSDEIEEMSGDFVWGSDSSVIYYMKMDEEHRPNRLYMHVLGTDASLDTLLLAEDDGMFWMGIEKSNSDRFLLISLGSKETSEYHYIDLDGLIGAEAHVKAISNMKCIQARQFGLRFDVEHHGEYFYLVTNAEKAKNNKIVYCPIDEPSKANWLDLVPYNPDVQIDELLPFANHFAIFGRENGIQVAWVAEASNPKQWRKISFGEETYSVWTEANCIYEAQVLRLGYTSFLTPKQVLDYDMISGTRTVLKEKEVPNYEPTNYRSSRIEATASDGRKIPMSLVFHKDAAPTDATRPLLLYGYGSYGACIEPTFDYKRISLLDRGVVYAIAHIRGGGEMGMAWYEDEGKYLQKKNTFTDFAACARHLVNIKYTSADQLAIVGRSAGGLLVGAVINMFPGLCKCAVADVPFVDVINSMSDPTIPLTVTEWEEWGNPNQEKFFDYMSSYSPYENVRGQEYPALLVTAGLNDPRVAYWEASKWVAKLREYKTDKNPLLLKTDMSSGHFSASDRYKLLKEVAFENAFIVRQICKP